MNLVSIQRQLRKNLEAGEIGLAIKLFNSSIVENDLEGELISDTLLTLSSQFTRLKHDNIKNVIDYGTFQKEYSKITANLSELINDLPLLKSRFRQENVSLSLNNSDSLLMSIQTTQTNKIEESRGELININQVIVVLIEELNVKRKEAKDHEKNRESLLKEIELLSLRIDKEQRKYDALKEEYNILKEEKNELINLKKELELLRKQTEERAEHIKILSDVFVTYKQMLTEKDLIIEKLKSEISKK
ncbi:hypothetical protein GO755_39365 [Spirosoma sp. HMF4905]|uniref:Effector-associated domain-containing protein n=1 Tax=Spirosoma arboris TaxID=2682092 RepID=A0A7K1SQR2_9BACT|nr:hypothetical protein [Spirosoma arboris]MVM36138.1 hypothetical protein [Spirosoma arboris]